MLIACDVPFYSIVEINTPQPQTFISLLLATNVEPLNNRVTSIQKYIDYIEEMDIYGHFSV